jgi:RimJ/RimL family protein N-acetyltransferase
MYPVCIRHGGVVLREFRQDDAAAVAALVGDERVVRWLSFDPRSRSESDAMLAGILQRAVAEPRNEYYLAVTSAKGGEVVGFARLGLDGVQAAKLGYAISADHWGHGYATDAASAMLGFAFTTLGLHRVSAAIGPENAASVAVVRRIGMTYEGRIRDHVFTHGAWRDSLLYSVLVAEWQARQRAVA